MAETTAIEWTEATWNPVTGCNKVSSGCQHCYAERLARRLKLMGVARYRNGFQVTLHPDLIDLPLHWSKPKMVFVNSMSDLYHEHIPDEFILQVFETMNRAPQHIFQILTKRAERLAQIAPRVKWTQNIWQGVTVESSEYTYRLDLLRTVPARVRFVSCEPLLSPLPFLDLRGVDWVIVGGESGPSARPMSPDWVRDIRDMCLESGTSFFFKQWGGVQKHKTGRVLDGQTWSQYPSSSSDRFASAFPQAVPTY